MSWNPNQGQDPNQPNPNPNPYGGYGSQPSQPNPEQPYNQPVQPEYPQPDYQQQSAYGQQQPPYGQQQAPYGQQQAPYGQAPIGAMDPNGPTSMGMSANVAAGLSYIFSWVTGLIFFFVEKQNKFVRFHAMQSIILGATYTVIAIILNVLSGIGLLSLLTGCAGILVFLLFIVASILCLVNAIQGKYFKLPVIGDYAERYANTINI